jgi:hypothetical protein
VTGDNNDLMVQNRGIPSQSTVVPASIIIYGSNNTSDGGLDTRVDDGIATTTYQIYGDNNNLNTNFQSSGLGTFKVTVNNKEAGSSALGNKISIDSGYYSSFKLDIQGDNNTYDFDARTYYGISSVNSYIEGYGNTQKFINGDKYFGQDVVNFYDFTTVIVGNNNSWDYVVGNNGFSHTVEGNGFAGEVTANSLSGGYKQSFSQLGSGTSSLIHSGGTVKISTSGSAGGL